MAQPFHAVIVVAQELFHDPKATGFMVREPPGCLFELVGRDGGNGPASSPPRGL